jgi:hypothetical protein
MEEWREVPGRPGYIVSNLGRAAKLLSLTPNRKGYIQYPIPDGDGGRHRDYLHHWVMSAFVGPRPEGMWVLHANDIGDDNRLSNLRYGTPAENAEDMILNGRKVNPTHCKYGHLKAGNNLNKDRSCRACTIARKRARRAKVKLTQTMRDEAYRELME